MKPLIGITASYDEGLIKLRRENNDAIYAAGGIPVILPFGILPSDIVEMANRLDGLLLSGGGDINPFLFGEEPLPELGLITPERDRFECLLIQEMLRQDKPILAICRGCQILNIAAGGDMYQDIYAQMPGKLLQHTQRAPREHASHYVSVIEGTLLHQIVGETKLAVNSYHHQAVRKMADGFEIAATASDGVIEAFFSARHQFVLGVQWHPEDLLSTDSWTERIFAAFVQSCGNTKCP